MLLFTGDSDEPVDPAASPSGEPEGGWAGHTIEVGSGTVSLEVGPGRHRVVVRDVEARVRALEAVGEPDGVGALGEPVSVLYLPPEYRWGHDGLTVSFRAEWRENAPSVLQSRRHLVTLSANPYALVVEAGGRASRPGEVEVLTAPVSALVIDEVTDGPTETRIRWRGWHVIDEGAGERILVTHSSVVASVLERRAG